MCYFYHVLDNPQITIDAICHALKDPKFDNPDLIVGTGMSGILLLVPVSIQSGVPFGAIRKPYESQIPSFNGGSHSGDAIEGYGWGNEDTKYVIIDDFIDSGKTIKTIVSTIENRYPSARCAGVIFYQGNPWHTTSYPTTILNYDIREITKLKEY